jgi:hypothetical protein
MKKLCKYLTGVLFLASSAYATAIAVNLGTADPFAILAGSTVTNTNITHINGSVGVSPGSATTGFGSVVQTNGTVHSADAVALQAKIDLTTAYGFAAGQACGTDLTGQDMANMVLVSGVYCFTSGAQLNGVLTLNSQGDPNAVFVFQMTDTLITGSSSQVSFINGGNGLNVFWQVGSSATLGTDTAFAGNILALKSITLNTRASIDCGRALAQTAAVTMDTNVVSIGGSGCDASSGAGSVPEPGTAGLLSIGMTFAGVGWWFRFRGRSTPSSRH